MCIDVRDFERMEYRKRTRNVVEQRNQNSASLVNRGRVLSRADLVDRIWTDGAEYVDENALSVTVKRLRDKLEETPSKPQYLKTVYGIGYTWEEVDGGSDDPCGALCTTSFLRHSGFGKGRRTP